MGLVPSRLGPSALVVALAASPFALASIAGAAELAADAKADIARAYAAASSSSSEEPAVRAERARREPSFGFMLGAALGAWSTAHAQLDFDLKNPMAAGPPHMSQTGDNDDALAQDCAEEKTAFAHLDARAAALGLTPADTLAASGATDAAPLAAAWQARKAGPAQACR